MKMHVVTMDGNHFVVTATPRDLELVYSVLEGTKLRYDTHRERWTEWLPHTCFVRVAQITWATTWKEES